MYTSELEKRRNEKSKKRRVRTDWSERQKRKQVRQERKESRLYYAWSTTYDINYANPSHKQFPKSYCIDLFCQDNRSLKSFFDLLKEILTLTSACNAMKQLFVVCCIFSEKSWRLILKKQVKRVQFIQILISHHSWVSYVLSHFGNPIFSF